MGGILHWGGPRHADTCLLIEVGLISAMTVGAIFARKGRYRTHSLIEASAVLVNLVMIGVFMLPVFPRHSWRRGLAVFGRPHFSVIAIHAVLGAGTETLALCVLLSAGTRLLPERLRIRNYKRWMRTVLLLWWTAFLAGGAVYYVWYVALPG